MGRRAQWVVVSIGALLAGVGAAVAIASTVSSTTTVGYLGGRMQSAVYGTSTQLWVQIADPSPASYAIPAGGGVITHWTIGVWRVNGSGGDVRLRVVKPEPGNGVFTVVGGDAQTLTEPEPTPRVFGWNVRIPVSGGERLAVMTSPDVWLGSWDSGGTPAVAWYDGDRSVGQTFTTAGSSAGADMRVEVTVEPDSDGDGYGDASQDGCPADAAHQAPPCAPTGTTTVTTTVVSTVTVTAPPVTVTTPPVTVTTPPVTSPPVTQTVTAAPITVARTTRACVVPPLRGLDRAEATRLLRRFGCKLGKVTLPQARLKRNYHLVVAAAPQAGTRLTEGAAVAVRLAAVRRR